MSTKKRNRIERMRRILSLILAIVMVISAAGTLIYYLGMGISATDVPTRLVENADDEIKIRVGLMYGSDVTQGFEVDTARGFRVVSVAHRSDSLSHEPLWELDITKLSCTLDDNLSKTDMTYSKAATLAKTLVGGYHIGIGKGMTRAECENTITAVSPVLDRIGLYYIPAYTADGYQIRTGIYSTAAETKVGVEALLEALPDLEIYTVSPSPTAVSLIDPLTDKILFEYDTGDLSCLGLAPLENNDGTPNYLITPAKKSYDGIFMFRRYNSWTFRDAGDTDGVALTDVIGLDDYIYGVLPYEVSASWPLETLKAFAICVRSFTLSGLNRHESTYDIDMCNTTHCQVYNGRGRITDSVIRAVDETSGLVMTYAGEIVTAYYSAVSGGVTVSSEDAWGGYIPYLQAIETPWEIYTNHSYGVWQTEATPAELASYLREKGYKQLRGSVASITVDEYAKDSTYIKKLTVTDTYGNKATIYRTDNVRNALSKFVKSANFVVGRGSVEADVTTFITETLTQTNVMTGLAAKTLAKYEAEIAESPDPESVSIGVLPQAPTMNNDDEQTVITKDGEFALSSLESAKIMSAHGLGTPGQLVSHTERQTLEASKSSNFIFYGKGYGHGVGISQIGLRDLALQGYGAQEMLCKYFTGIEIIPYNELY